MTVVEDLRGDMPLREISRISGISLSSLYYREKERRVMYWTPLELDNLTEETCLYRHTSQQVRITVTHPEVIDR